MTTKKDLTDALRERCFPEEASPSEGSWEGIAGRMHRRAVRRRTVSATLAILVPVGAVMLFGPCRTVPDKAAGLEQPVTIQTENLLALQDEEQYVPLIQEEVFKPSRIPAASGRPAVPVHTDSEPLYTEPAATESDTAPAVAGHSAHKPAEARPTVSEPVVTEPVDSFQEFSETEDIHQVRKKNLSVNIHASGAAGRMESDRIAAYPSGSGVHSKSPESDFYNMVSIIEQVPVHYRHDIPLSAGLTLRWDLSPRLSLESGLTYSYLHSYENLFGDQRLHFVGIPLRLNVLLFSAGPLEVGAGGYGMAEKCLSARQGKQSVKEPGIQWSSGAFLDAGYRIGSSVSLYMQPSISYYFTKTELLTYRTENPLGFSLQAGLRFHL